MKRRCWSVGLVVPLAIIIGSLILAYYIVARPWSDERPPSFDELQVVSGQVEYVKWNEGGEYEHSSIGIKLRELPNEFLFLYWTPYIHEVDLALIKASRELSSIKLWVALRYYNYPAWGILEVWQVAVDGVVISSYQDRVDWGESRVGLRKFLVVSFIILLDLIPGIILYQNLKKARVSSMHQRENGIAPGTKRTVSKEQLSLPFDKSTGN